jgi:hypothetical protein
MRVRSVGVNVSVCFKTDKGDHIAEVILDDPMVTSTRFVVYAFSNS